MQPKTVISIYSHFFTVDNPSPSIIKAIYRLCQDYTKMELKKTDPRKKAELTASTTYGIYAHGGRHFRFVKGQYKELLKMFQWFGVRDSDYDIVYMAKPTAVEIDLPVKEGWTLRDYQEEAAAFAMEDSEEIGANSPLLMLPVGTGKALQNGTLVKVPGGWTPIETLTVGDYVTAIDGSPSKVTGVFPQGVKKAYKITFSDGRSLKCCGEHLWEVHTTSNWGKNTPRVIDTLEIYRLLYECSSYRKYLFIDFPDSEDGPDKDLPIDPYLLGMYLGDGSSTSFHATISKGDSEAIESFAAHLDPEDYLVFSAGVTWRISARTKGKRSSLKSKLLELGLWGKRSWEKEIPDIYLNSSHAQRLSLIQGLMDTDGTVGRDGVISFTSTSRQLANGLQSLVRSIGGYAKMTSRIANFTYLGEQKAGRVSYTVFIRIKNPSRLFTLSRKKARVNDENQYSGTLKLRIDSVEEIDEAEMTCISIDHPRKLFVAEDFIVTHNTVCSIIIASRLKKRLAVVILARYKDKWVSDIKKSLDISDKDILVADSGDLIKRASHYKNSGLDIPKVTIITLSSMLGWFTTYEGNKNDPALEAYGCLPHEFFESMGIGTIIMDEIHQHSYSVYRLLCHTHVEKVIALSATLFDPDKIVQKMQQAMFPRSARYDKVKMKKYIKVTACMYQIARHHLPKIKTTERGSTMYSQVAFEECILKNVLFRTRYMSMMFQIIRHSIQPIAEKRDRIAFFVGRETMAIAMKEAIQKEFPQYITKTYLQKDPYEHLHTSDIVITTIGSAGTGQDIKDLRFVVLTNNIKSPNANVQVLGRLRELPDRDVHFFYLFCNSIPKQVEYHHAKRELFEDKVLSQGMVYLDGIM